MYAEQQNKKAAKSVLSGVTYISAYLLVLPAVRLKLLLILDVVEKNPELTIRMKFQNSIC